ncbi:hypothetical protein HCH_05700 [Hahella chejuensis KCTC 2396]|uniref:Uncharacterized protein n=1 Tax=Hahella chejuensis (strain KCTC 2396) TaxID=349521 RepID=Q2SAG8_HAHCH|nr:hypothetical protein HCH_05700 [Hahella chejuensis KCTC 2396]
MIWRLIHRCYGKSREKEFKQVCRRIAVRQEIKVSAHLSNNALIQLQSIDD